MHSYPPRLYTLSLHDALPIFASLAIIMHGTPAIFPIPATTPAAGIFPHCSYILYAGRSEEHTSELQSQSNLVCRLLLETKNNYARTDERDKIEIFMIYQLLAY